MIKATPDLLIDKRSTLSQIRYPYMLIQTDLSSENFLICGINSCFASTPDSAEINGIIRETF